MDQPTSDEHSRARAVREMFGAIASRYDFLNHFLSLNIDRRWRRLCLKEVGNRLHSPQPRILDIGCGTADLSLEFSSLGSVVGCDFSHPMLKIGLEKMARSTGGNTVHLLEGDALMLPFADRSFDVAVSAFVLRNLSNMQKGLEEMRRILRPGGVLGVLDFGLPRVPVLSGLYIFYFTRILPKLGRIISGVEGPYRYLPDSVRTFPPAEELSRIIAGSGFRDVQFRPLTAGIAVLFLGTA